MNNQLIKAKPELHKKTFLKPLHKSAEFCSTCHKVHLPVELNHYKDFLRGQNHYDTFILSGAGNGSRSFYFPPKGKSDNCAVVPHAARTERRLRLEGFRRLGRAQAALALLPRFQHRPVRTAQARGPRLQGHEPQLQKAIDQTAEFLRGTAVDGSDKKLRIDIFGVKEALARRESAEPDDDNAWPWCGPRCRSSTPGETHLIEVVIRTLNIGHPFSQGTVDSNEIWVDFQATAGGKVDWPQRRDCGTERDGRGRSVVALRQRAHARSQRQPHRPPQPAGHLHAALQQADPAGSGAGRPLQARRAEGRGGAGRDHRANCATASSTTSTWKLVHKEAGKPVPKLPIVDICEDSVTLPVAGVAENVPAQESPIKPAWQRWNDYGIGCLIEGGAGSKRGNLRQAEAAFAKLLTLGAKDALWHGHLNLARVYIEQGRLCRGEPRTERRAGLRPARAVVGAGVVQGSRHGPERDHPRRPRRGRRTVREDRRSRQPAEARQRQAASTTSHAITSC